jgi:hypothetical protein
MSLNYNHPKEQFTWRKNNAGTFLTSLGSFFGSDYYRLSLLAILLWKLNFASQIGSTN